MYLNNNEGGLLTSNQADIEREIRDYYLNLYRDHDHEISKNKYEFLDLKGVYWDYTWGYGQNPIDYPVL